MDDARCASECRQPALRPGRGGVRGATAPARAHCRCLSVPRSPRPSDDLRDLGRHAAVLGACRAVRSGHRRISRFSCAGPRRSAAWRAKPIARGRNTSGHRLASSARCDGGPGLTGSLRSPVVWAPPHRAFRGRWPPSPKGAWCVERFPSAATRDQGGGACTESTIRSCGFGSASWLRTGRRWRCRRPRRGCATGTATAPPWSRTHGRSCPGCRCLGSIGARVRWPPSVRSSKPDASGAEVPRSSTSCRGRSTASVCSSGNRNCPAPRGWSSRVCDQAIADVLPEERGRQVVRVLFTPSATNVGQQDESVVVVDAGTVMAALR